MTIEPTLEPIDLFWELMSDHKGSVAEIKAGPMWIKKIMLETTNMLLMVQLSKEAATEIAREGYWYREFYMASLAVARGMAAKVPNIQLEKLQERLSMAEKSIIRMKMNIYPSAVERTE